MVIYLSVLYASSSTTDLRLGPSSLQNTNRKPRARKSSPCTGQRASGTGSGRNGNKAVASAVSDFRLSEAFAK